MLVNLYQAMREHGYRIVHKERELKIYWDIGVRY